MVLLKTPKLTSLAARRKSWSASKMARSQSGHSLVREFRGKNDEEDQVLADELLADEKGTCRARQRWSTGSQRRWPRREVRLGQAQRRDGCRALLERHAHHVERLRPAPGWLTSPTPCEQACQPERSPAPESPRDGRIIDELERHRRGPVRRSRRLHRLHRQHGYLHRFANSGHAGPDRLRPGAPALSPTASPRTSTHETLNKAKGLLRAIELAEKQF